MTKSEEIFLERYVNKVGATSNTNTIDIVVSILAREFMKSAKKGKELVTLGEPEAFRCEPQRGNILMDEGVFMSFVQFLENAIKNTIRTSNSVESWDENIYAAFRDFRNNISRTRLDE